MATPIATAFVRLRPDTSGFGKEIKQDVDKAGRGVAQQGKKHGRVFGATFAKATAGPFRAIGGIFTKSIVGISGAFAAIGAVKVFSGFIRDARESNKIARITAQVIRSTGGSAKVSAAQVDALATALSNKTGKDDEAIQSGQNMLLTFTNIRNEVGKGNDIFNQASSTLLDMTAAMNGGNVSQEQMRKQAIQLGKALNDPIRGISALRRVGVTFTDQQTEQIKKLVESGHSLEAQKIILRELGKEFGGTAAASTDPMEKLRVVVENLGERIGKALIPAFTVIASVLANKVIPAVGKFIGPLEQNAVPIIVRVVKFVRELIAVVGPILANALVTIGGIVRDQLFPALQRLAQNVGPVLLIIFEDLSGVLKTLVLPGLKILAAIVADRVVPAIATLAKWIKDNREIIPALGIAIGVVLVPAFVAWAVAAGAAAVATIAAAAPVVALVVVIAGAAFLIIKHWKTITKAFKTAFDWVKHNWPLLLAILTGPIGLATAAIIKNFKTIKDVFRAVFLFVANLFFDVVRGIIHGVGNLVSVFAKLPGPLGKPFKKAKEAIKGAEQSVKDLQDRINRTHGKSVTVSVKMQMKNRLKIAAQQGVALTITGKPIALGHAKGGLIRGPGGPVGDKIPAALSDGEYVIKAASARKLGTQFLDTLNSASSIGGDPAGMTLGFAAGGSVSRAQALIRAQASDPYIWGGVGPNGFDCSGLAGLPYAALTGRALYRRYFTTASDFRSLGFKPGTGAYTIGVNPYTHMAGNIGGLPFEAASTRSGIHVGRGAQSVMRFAKQYFLASLGGVFGGNGSVNLGNSDLRKLMKAIHINWGVRTGVNPVSFDRGGWLRPGLTLAHNGTGRSEPVGGARVIVDVTGADSDLKRLIRKMIRVQGGDIR